MSREVLISALAALGCHALLLFGLRMEKQAVPLPVTDTEVEVSLIAAASQSPAPPALEPPAAEVTPPPAPLPEVLPELPTLEPMITPIPESKPRPPQIPKRIAQRPAKPSAPATTQRTEPLSGSDRLAFSAGPTFGNTRPRYRSNPRPDYPSDARQQRQQGRVVLAVEVSAEGRPTSVSLQRSSGFPALDSAALAAVRRWTFEPARTAGVPVPARVEVPVQFDLSR